CRARPAASRCGSTSGCASITAASRRGCGPGSGRCAASSGPTSSSCARPAIAATEAYWREWIGRFRAATDWPDAVRRSLLTLQALTEAETGGILAAPTTSLPEVLGGECNWDYRYTWLRDSTFALSAFLNAGYREEAREWRDWLLRAAAGVPDRLRTMYRSDASRNIVPHEVPWLAGYEQSAPVHVGNPAASQFQLDIYGEVLDSLHLCERAGLADRPWDIAIETRIAGHIRK